MSNTRTRRGAARAAVLALIGAALIPVAPAEAYVLSTTPAVEQRTASGASADALPTVQIDTGVVWAQAIVGNIVYAGGDFKNARPAGSERGQNLTPRSNLLAYDVTTGKLIESFAPQVNGPVKAIAASPDGSRIYVGGSFNSINGKVRWNVAAFDARTGALLLEWQPAIGGSYVNAISATNNAVYVGGLFSQAGGVGRTNLAAFDSNGGLLGWAPTASGQVDAMVVNPAGDKVVLGGRFGRINSTELHGLAAVSTANGSVVSWSASSSIRVGGFGSLSNDAGISSLVTDGKDIFGTAWVWRGTAAGNLEGTFSLDGNTGAIRWINDGHGDNYGSYVDGDQFYFVGHPHDYTTSGGFPNYATPSGDHQFAMSVTKEPKGTLQSITANASYANWGGKPTPAIYAWFPNFLNGNYTGQGQAGWSITGNDKYVVVGGEFQAVNGRSQYGLVRFARDGADRTATGPESAPGKPSVSATAGGGLFTAAASWDRDDLTLTYQLYRSGTATPVASKQMATTSWNKGSVILRDTTATAGQTYTYYVKAVDRNGNSTSGPSVSVNVPSGTIQPSNAYTNLIKADGPALYYRLGSPTSQTGLDWAGSIDGLVRAGVSAASTGAIAGDTTNRGSTFSGTSTGYVVTSANINAYVETTAEVWVRTTTTKGGVLVQRGNAQSGTSGSYDRMIWMQNNGQIRFGVWPGEMKSIASSAAYNDGKWHHVVGTNGRTGTQLYVDGALVAADLSVVDAEASAGFWWFGGGNLSGWANRPTSDYLAGDLDEVALYRYPLSPAQVSAHYQAATGGVAPAVGPTASFTASASNLVASLDASASVAASGKTITGYAWNYGDGSTGAGVSGTHTYATAGTYSVTLTVTDSAGLTATAAKSVTVTAGAVSPDDPPTASFTASATALKGSFDASASRAVSGRTITGYAWNFGDGSTGTGVTATRSYAAAGTYTVTLTVTDSAGQTATATRALTVTDPAGPPAGKLTYPETVKTDGATLYWRFGSTTRATDQVGSNDGTYRSAAGTGATGAIAGDSDGASRFTDSPQSYVVSKSIPAPDAYSTEIWLKTTTNTGGTIIQRGSANSGDSSSHDRLVYMLNDGRIRFGVWPNAVKYVTTPRAYNDGGWHHLVSTNGPAGTFLYIDGVAVASDTSVTSAENSGGYWRVGYDSMGGWPDAPRHWAITADLDEFAVYGKQLTAAQIANHYAVGLGR